MPLILQVSNCLLSFSARSNHSCHWSAFISANHFFTLAMVARLPSGGNKMRLAIFAHGSAHGDSLQDRIVRVYSCAVWWATATTSDRLSTPAVMETRSPVCLL